MWNLDLKKKKKEKDLNIKGGLLGWEGNSWRWKGKREWIKVHYTHIWKVKMWGEGKKVIRGSKYDQGRLYVHAEIAQ
jgi:hypothetical protein